VNSKREIARAAVVSPLNAKLASSASEPGHALKNGSGDPPFLKKLLKLAKDRDWPADFALNHAHYAKGYPKTS
jgi:hypothetical protein